MGLMRLWGNNTVVLGPLLSDSLETCMDDKGPGARLTGRGVQPA
jgi:hypothetical protein